MAIVSRGEITVTNVNDGKTPYFHTAYTSSADFGAYDYSGNPNLSAKLNASSFSSGTGATVADDNDEIVFTLDGTNPLSKYTTIGQTPLAEGKEYTISCEIMLESDFVGDPTGIKLQHAYFPGGILMLQTDTVPKNELNTWQKLIGTKTMPHYSNTPNVWYPLFRDTRNLKPSGKVRLRNIKIEEGPTATPFQPNLLDAPYYLSTVSLGENIANPAKTFPIKTREYLVYSGANTEPYIAGQQYILTMKATKPATQTFNVFINEGTIGFGSMTPVEGLTDVWQKKITVGQNHIGAGVKDRLTIYQVPISSVGACQIDWLKIEKGDTRTPNIDSYKYLGSYTDFDQTDSLNPTKYSWSLIKGSDGIAGKDGVGIKSTQIMYAQSTSGTTPPATGWTSQVPTLIKGQYLWTQTTWVYTDNTGEAGYTVSYNAKDGNNGTDGIAGKDGVGISNTKVEYVGSTNGTTKPTSGWTTTIPTVAEGNFLWTRTTWTYTDSTSEVGYSVAKMGAKGDKGNTGDSATSYWITPSVNTIQISATKVLNPTTITFTGYSKTGTANAGLYAGRFNILTSVDGIVYSSKYSSSANQSAYTYTVPADVKFIKARMYQAGGTSVLVDEVTIPIIESAEGLEIGGRNLLTNTQSPTADKLPSLIGSTPSIKQPQSLSISDGAVRISKVANSTEEVYYRFMDPSDSNIAGTPLVGGATYTLSLDIRANLTNSNKLKFRAQYKLATGDWVYLPEWDGSTFISGINGSTFIRVSSTFTLPVGATTFYFSLQMFDNTGLTPTNGNWFEFKNAKLEKGNKPTDWTPAPEDAKLYTAWSNKEDGSVDFTKKYPRENLALNSRIVAILSNNASLYPIQTTDMVEDGESFQRAVRTSLNPTIFSVYNAINISEELSNKLKGHKIEVSGMFRASREVNMNNMIVAVYKDQSNTNKNASADTHGKTVKLNTSWQQIGGIIDLTDTANINKITTLRCLPSQATIDPNEGFYYDAKNFKFSIIDDNDEVITTYTTPPTEDPIKAEMAYIGYSPKDSNDPADYVWSENPKAKGTFQRWSNVLGGSELSFATVLPTLNIVENGDFLDTVDGTAALNPGIYPNRWGGYNGGVSDPTKNWHAHVNQTTFGYNVVEYNESNGVRSWKGITQSIGTTSDAFAYLQDVKQDMFISLDIYTTMTGANNKVFGGFYYTSKSLGTIAFHAGQFNITPTTPNKWQRLSATAPLNRDDVDWTKSLSFYIYGYGFSNNAIIYIKDVNISEGTSEMFLQSPFEAGNSRFETVPKYIGFGIKDSNNPSDFQWTTNPDYTQALTDSGLEDKVDNDSYENDKSDIWEEIGNRTTEEEAAAIREMAESIKNSYEAFVSSGGQYQLDLEALEARSALLVQNLGDQLATYNFLKTYIKLGEEGLVIGADGSSMKMLLSKDKLSFTDGGQVVAYFSNQSFYINRGAIVDSLQVGQHKMVKLNSDHTVFQWVKV